MEEKNEERFIVMTAAACMPGACKYGPYGKVAVVERNLELPPPKQIHPRHKSVKRIVQVWDRLYVGTTERCAFRIAEAEAIKLRNKLNSAHE